MGARLIDILLAGHANLVPPAGTTLQSPKSLGAWRESLNALLADLPRAQIFVIDNVAKYYYETQCKNWDLHHDFPNLAPPFDVFWLEYNPPTRILEREDPTPFITTGPTVMRDARGLMGRVGCLAMGREMRPDDWKIQVQGEPKKEDYRFQLMTFMFTEGPDQREIVAGAGINLFQLDSEGQVNAMTPCWYAGSKLDINGTHTWYSGTQLMSIPMYLALCFLHCKNVKIARFTPPPPLSKKWQRRTGRPLVRYNILEITPMKKILENEGQASSTGLEKALHICRGHFKDYRAGGGLGRYHAKGLWWWDSHLRGNLKEGIVDKEYDVKAV